jgi:electron transfer flavoprotein beta subunit
MNIAVCYKWVTDEADITVNSDLTLNFDRAAGKISEYDKNAIEAGVQLKKALGGKLYGVCFGGDDSRASLKDALSRGLDEAIWVHAADAAKADEITTAAALKTGLEKIDDIGAVLCGDGSSDNYARQIPARVAAALGIPCVSLVSALRPEESGFLAVRKYDDGEEDVEVSGPAVFAILPEMAAAPIPGLKSVMAAKKKPITEVPADELTARGGAGKTTVATTGYVMKRKNIPIEGENGSDKVTALISALEKEGVL